MLLVVAHARNIQYTIILKNKRKRGMVLYGIVEFNVPLDTRERETKIHVAI